MADERRLTALRSGVIGVGTDVVEIERFRTILRDRPGLIERVFTDHERAIAERRVEPARPFAARFAAKEAAMKAMGVGLGEVRFHDLEVRRAASGAPSLVVTGSAGELARSLGIAHWHLSMSHGDLIAQAFVVAEA